MQKVVKQLFLSGVLLAVSFGSAFAAGVLKPFVLAYTTSGDIQAVADEVKGKVEAAGFEVAGTYSPYDGAIIIAITNDDLKKSAASSDFGGYEAGQRVTVTKVGDEVQVSYSNPEYYANAYRLDDTSGAATALKSLETALGNKETFGSGEKQLSAADLRKYHYMFGMEYFDDPSELASYDSQADAIAAVEEGLAKGRGGATKVYRIDIPGKDETVFGVALNDSGCSGDEYIMSRVDRDPLRSTAHLPYEILVSDGDVYALYARFRIAISWPHLPMIQSETGATFFNIMCAPNAIEEALINAAGGDI
ncbi:MAG: hypothetical protein BMS9Abin08_1249 [Gammaproteobacteria bacterium]|nr:MAG: hypothetical protein BMS9Abin08_1249 [Gammaproteobacteria bacterium]